MRSAGMGVLLLAALPHAPAANGADLPGCIFASHGGAVAYVEYRYRVRDGSWDATRGSGFVIAGDGHILTNHHVVSPNPADAVKPVVGARVVVRLGGLAEEERPATVLRRDEAMDLALLKIDARAQPWPAVPLGDSSTLRPGDLLVGMGFPGGDLAVVPPSMLTAANAVVHEVRKPWWQTGLALNPGNSGGPVFDGRGTVVGMAVAVREGTQQITYAIPMQYALGLAQAGGARMVPAGPCAASAAPGYAGAAPPSSAGQQMIIGAPGGVTAGTIVGGTYNLGGPPPAAAEPPR